MKKKFTVSASVRITAYTLALYVLLAKILFNHILQRASLLCLTAFVIAFIIRKLKTHRPAVSSLKNNFDYK